MVLWHVTNLVNHVSERNTTNSLLAILASYGTVYPNKLHLCMAPVFTNVTLENNLYQVLQLSYASPFKYGVNLYRNRLLKHYRK